jgi:hypothetical protein
MGESMTYNNTYAIKIFIIFCIIGFCPQPDAKSMPAETTINVFTESKLVPSEEAISEINKIKNDIVAADNAEESNVLGNNLSNGWCLCSSAPEPKRIDFTYIICAEIKNKFPDKESKVIYTSVGSGGFLQDYMILKKLIKDDYKNLVVNIIDPQYNPKYKDPSGYTHKIPPSATVKAKNWLKEQLKQDQQASNVIINEFDSIADYKAACETQAITCDVLTAVDPILITPTFFRPRPETYEERQQFLKKTDTDIEAFIKDSQPPVYISLLQAAWKKRDLPNRPGLMKIWISTHRDLVSVEGLLPKSENVHNKYVRESFYKLSTNSKLLNVPLSSLIKDFIVSCMQNPPFYNDYFIGTDSMVNDFIELASYCESKKSQPIIVYKLDENKITKLSHETINKPTD